MKKSTAQSKFGFLNLEDLEDLEMAFMENSSNPPVVLRIPTYLKESTTGVKIVPKILRNAIRETPLNVIYNDTYINAQGFKKVQVWG